MKTAYNTLQRDIDLQHHQLTLSTDTPTRVPNMAHQQTSSSVCTTFYSNTTWNTKQILTKFRKPANIHYLKNTYHFRTSLTKTSYTNNQKENWLKFKQKTCTLSLLILQNITLDRRNLQINNITLDTHLNIFDLTLELKLI